MRRVETAFLLGLGAFLIGFCLLGQFYYHYSPELMRFPLLAAGFTLFVAVVHFVGLILRPSSRGVLSSAAGPQAGHERRGILADLLWLGSVLPLVFLLGFPVGLAAYLFAVLRRAGEAWAVTVSLSGASLLVSYGLFVEVLGVSLPLVPMWWPY